MKIDPKPFAALAKLRVHTCTHVEHGGVRKFHDAFDKDDVYALLAKLQDNKSAAIRTIEALAREQSFREPYAKIPWQLINELLDGEG